MENRVQNVKSVDAIDGICEYKLVAMLNLSVTELSASQAPVTGTEHQPIGRNNKLILNIL